MHARSPTPKDALIPLINELYERIRAIEAEHGFWAGVNDYRPRIELFHDAIRALVAGHSPYEAKGRLTLERLAWDINTLRMLQGNPLTKMAGADRQSPSQALVVKSSPQATNLRGVRSELAEFYKNYTVLFVAMLAETADMNHRARMEDIDLQVEELAELQQHINGKTQVNLHKEADQLTPEPERAAQIKSMLPPEKLAAADARSAIKAAHVILDKRQKNLETQHMQWLSGQLQCYEESKTLVQKFMQSGLNVAGKFLQETMQQGGQGRGTRGY
jgi:hypothetical protein